MDTVLEVINLIGKKNASPKQILRAMRIVTSIMEVHDQGYEEAIASILYPFNFSESEVFPYGNKVRTYVKTLRELDKCLRTIDDGWESGQGLNRYLDRVAELDEGGCLIVICQWLYRIEQCVIGMGIGKRDWELVGQVTDIVRGKLGESNVVYYINQLDIHRKCLHIMEWVRD